ncbi:SRPBCC family protein [Pelagibacterium sp.]|uniref:SRPBCC family protein n=1 Tax=Pelagibacterium sp. TaxID=1967288 RepID=UPI003BABE2D5
MTDQAEHSITLSRTIDAPADELFAAWTDPALLEQWQAENVEFEPFEGGKFRFETSDADEPGVTHVISGTVASYEQDRKLVELWHMEGEDAEHDSTLIVTFAPVDGARTEITIVEIAEAHADAESRIFSIEAWHEALNELAELLE